jgi:hypothetical protein
LESNDGMIYPCLLHTADENKSQGRNYSQEEAGIDDKQIKVIHDQRERKSSAIELVAKKPAEDTDQRDDFGMIHAKTYARRSSRRNESEGKKEHEKEKGELRHENSFSAVRAVLCGGGGGGDLRRRQGRSRACAWWGGRACARRSRAGSGRASWRRGRIGMMGGGGGGGSVRRGRRRRRRARAGGW